MTSSTVIAQLNLTTVERRRRESIERNVSEARRGQRRGFWRRRSRGSVGASPPGGGGKLLQL